MLKLRKLLSIWSGVPVLSLAALSSAYGVQSDEPPRRIESPSTIVLPGGSEVRFPSFFAESLGEEIRYSIFLPPSYGKQPGRSYPVVYFLHGLFNDDTSWCVERYGNIPRGIEDMMVADRVPEFVMVHPQGQNSFYTDSSDGSRLFEKYIYRDLLQHIETDYRVRTNRSNRAIGGTSMGAYGALKLAMKHPELYASVLASSPIVLLGDDPTVYWSDSTSRFGRYLSQVFASVFGDPLDNTHWQANSLERLAKGADLGDLQIRLVYGTADRYNGRIPMEKGIRELDAILKSRGVSVDLAIYDGEPHGWRLVFDHLEENIEFLTKTFSRASP